MDLTALLGDNQILQGGFVLMLMGALLAYARNVPKVLFSWAKRRFSVTLQLRDPNMVLWVGRWLSKNSYAKKCRLLNVWSSWREKDETSGPCWVPIMEPGLGIHVFRYNGRWVVFTHSLEDKGSNDNPFVKLRTMTLWCLGRDPKPLRNLIEEVVSKENSSRFGKQVAFINDEWGEWKESKISEPRPQESIILPSSMRQEILGDAEWFLSASGWHHQRGLPYRRGYLFWGPPGNGKSTMIQILAGAFNLPIYMASITEGKLTDSSLTRMFSLAPERAVLALEDIDKISFDKDVGITLSGFLNAIDGVLASSGRIFVITANDISGLPSPLLRAGRVDRTWKFPLPNAPEVSMMFRRFYPEADGQADTYGSLVQGKGLPMSAIQQHLIRYPTALEALQNMEALLESENRG